MKSILRVCVCEKLGLLLDIATRLLFFRWKKSPLAPPVRLSAYLHIRTKLGPRAAGHIIIIYISRINVKNKLTSNMLCKYLCVYAFFSRIFLRFLREMKISGLSCCGHEFCAEMNSELNAIFHFSKRNLWFLWIAFDLALKDFRRCVGSLTAFIKQHRERSLNWVPSWHFNRFKIKSWHPLWHRFFYSDKQFKLWQCDKHYTAFQYR